MVTTVKDFITRYGVLVQGTNVVTSSTGQTNALQVNGGAAIAKNLIVGTTADIYGTLTARNSLIVNGPVQISGNLSGNTANFSNNVTLSDGLLVNGISTFSNTVNVTGIFTASNTATFNNGLVSNGPSIFNGPLTLNGGGSVNLGTSDLSLTGNLSVGGTGSFNSSTFAAAGGVGALVVPNGGIYVGQNLYIAGTNANTGTNVSNSLYLAGGAWIEKTLVVGGDSVFKGNVTFSGSTTFVLSTNSIYTDNIINLHTPPGGISGAWTLDDGKDVGFIFHNYKGVDNDSFLGWANDSGYLEWYGSGLETVGGTFTNAVYGIFKTGGIILTNTETSVSKTTGALQVNGGIGANNVFATNDISGNTLTARNLTEGRIVFAGAGGELTDDAELTYDALSNLLSADVSRANTATNIAGGGPGMIPYQLSSGITSFINTGSAGFILISNGTSAPYWQSLGSISAGNATTATNIAGGSANQLVIQTAPGITGFVGPGNDGQFLRSNGPSNPPSYVNTGNMYVGYAEFAKNLRNPVIGAIPYQSGIDLTSFILPGNNGTLLQSNGSSATFVSTTTLLVGFAENAYTANKWTTPRTVTLAGDISGFATFDGSTDFIFTATVNAGGFSNTATNLANGTIGAIPYQSAPSSTTFLTLSNTEHSVISAGTNAPKYVTEVQAKSGTGSSTTNTTQSLIVSGGIGISGDSYFANNVGIETNLKIKGTTSSTNTQSGALQVDGGVGIAKNIVVGGSLQVGPVAISAVVPAIYSNNVLLASYTSPTIVNANPVNLDQYLQSEFRTARYTVQIVDGSNIHITEIMVTHNGTNVYINEYGIITNNGELGTFSANSDGTNITLTFTPSIVSSMTIKVVRFGITA